jgi:hypothetical protein
LEKRAERTLVNVVGFNFVVVSVNEREKTETSEQTNMPTPAMEERCTQCDAVGPLLASDDENGATRSGKLR